MKKTVLSILVLMLTATVGWACSNFIVTKGASKDGSIMVSYSADSHQLYGCLYFWPARDWPQGTMYPVYDWDTGEYRGEIPQVAHTYRVTGNMNEHQLLIGETTFGGLEALKDTSGRMDYGTLIYLCLQRCRTAREAIALIDNLTQTYGYASEGESFSIADAHEVWIMEIMPKTTGGSVWVARRIPDGYISGHANHARITTLDFKDKENCLYAKDVISYAREMGLFSGKDSEFSFAGTYCPIDAGSARGCEARVWQFFNRYAQGMDQYLAYAMGRELDRPFPLYVKPSRKLGVEDVAAAMRDHYEDTPMDMRYDVGAGGNECPYRWRPMGFEVDGKTYINERATATQQTGWWYVGQCRDWLPDPVGGLFWFGVDDAATSPLMPIYCALDKAPWVLSEENGSMMAYSETSMFWLVNRITQFCYLRYNQIGAEVRSVVEAWEAQCREETEAIDKAAVELYKTHPDLAVSFLNQYSQGVAQQAFDKWKALDSYLLVKYIDGNIKCQNPDGSFTDNGAGKAIPKRPQWGGYTERWLRRIAQDHGSVVGL